MAFELCREPEIPFLNKGFVQWINGSFISNKQNPGDMDFVTLMDFSTFNQHQNAIENEFTLLERNGITKTLMPTT